MPFGRFLYFVVQRSRSMAWLMVCVGVLSGLLSAGVLALINYVLHHPSDHSSPVILGFVVLVAGKILSNLGSQLLLVRFSQDTILDLSLSLCAKIVRAPLRRSEQRGAANTLVILTDDVSWVTWAIQCFPHLIMNGAVVLGCGFILPGCRGAYFWGWSESLSSAPWGISGCTPARSTLSLQPGRRGPNCSDIFVPSRTG